MRDITFLVGLTEAELLTIRAAALSRMVSGSAVPGQTVSSVNTRDLSVSYGGDIKSDDLIIAACNYALQKLNPAVYGTDQIRRKVKWIA